MFSLSLKKFKLIFVSSQILKDLPPYASLLPSVQYLILYSKLEEMVLQQRAHKIQYLKLITPYLRLAVSNVGSELLTSRASVVFVGVAVMKGKEITY